MKEARSQLTWPPFCIPLPVTTQEARLTDRNEYERDYYAKNKEVIAARRKAWRERRVEEMRAKSREYYEANKEREAARNKAYRTENRKRHAENKTALRHREPSRFMLLRVRGRAKATGQDFNLTIEDCVIPETCPVLGIPLTYAGARTDNTASMDRIDSAKGYTKGNVHVISYRANRIKNDATVAELLKVAAYFQALGTG